MRAPWRPRLLVVLVLSFVAVATLPVLVLSVQRYVWITSDLLHEDLREDAALAHAVAAGLEREVGSHRHRLEIIARDIGEQRFADRAALADEADKLRRRNPDLTGVVVTDVAGVVIAASPAVDATGRPQVGKRFDDREWFREALARSTRPPYDVVVSRGTNPGAPTLPIAVPILSEDGRTLGVLGVGFNLDGLRDVIRKVGTALSARLVLVDARGRVIAHTSPQYQAEAKDLSGEQVFKAAMAAPEGSLEYDSSFTGRRQWATFVRLPGTGWTVWATRDLGQGRLRYLLRDVVVSGVASLLIAALAAIAIGRAIARPALAIASAAGEIVARRFDGTGRIEKTPRIREFAQLAEAFRSMAAGLRARYEDLEAEVAERTRALEQRAREAQTTAALLQAQEAIQRGYAELAALLNSLDRSYILQEGTRKVAASIGSPLAAVYLTDDGPDALRVKTYAAIDDGVLETADLVPSGLPAEVARRGEPVVLAAGSHEAIRLRTGLGTVEIAAVAGFPLRHQQQFLGVLVVASLVPLTDQTRSFLEGAARQLSVALSNAGLFESVRFQSQRLEELNQDLRRATEVKSQFLASMSHELRTPLNSIIGFTELLLTSRREPLSDRQRTSLERVLASGRHLLGLINEVLDLSKIEAGRMEVRAETFAIAGLIRECLETVEPQAHAKGLRLVATGLEPDTEIVQDRGKLKQVLLNLLSNAVKFTAEGRVEVKLRREERDRLALEVADTGPGISPEDQATIFEPFRQAGTDAAAGGTGLGLAISRRLAELMGGSLGVDSKPGDGSVFTLRVPIRVRSEDGAAPQTEHVEAASARTLGPRILIIDDDRDVADLVRGALSEEAFAVDAVWTAAEGLVRARRDQPALILLDVVLQGPEDGWDMLRALKTDPATRAIPVIVHSVIDNPQRAHQLGAVDVLLKPMDAATLRLRVRRLLESGPGETADG